MIKVDTRVVKEILDENCQSCNKSITVIKEIFIGNNENFMALTRLCPSCYQELKEKINQN